MSGTISKLVETVGLPSRQILEVDLTLLDFIVLEEGAVNG